MKRFLSTLNVFLRHEIISLVVYLIATILLVFITSRMEPSINAQGEIEPVKTSLLMISMLSIFIGLYLGSGFLRLRQSHLWFTHNHYRMNLIYSLVSAALIYGVIQFLTLYHIGWSIAVAAIAPVCVTLLTAQLVIARNLIMKFIFPALPFILYQLNSYDISINILLILLLALTILAIYLNSNNNSKPQNDYLGLMSGNIRQQMKAPSMQRLNRFSMLIMQTFRVKSNKADFSEALLQPSNRYGISSVFLASFFFIVIYLIGDKKLGINVFGIMILGSMMLNQFIDIQMLSRQPKPFAHLFSKDHHALFKHKTLLMLDKHVIIQAGLTILSLLLISFFVNGLLESLVLIKLGLAIMIIARAFAPLMLCLDWFNVNLKLIIVVAAYVLTGITFCGWLLENDLSQTYGLKALGGLALLILIRIGSTYLWKRQPIEQFMRVYG